MKKYALFLLTAILVVNIVPMVINIQLVKAGTIIVPDDYPTIQGAINAASNGDIVYVRNGTYYEDVIVNRSISLIGENQATTKIGLNRDFDPNNGPGLTLSSIDTATVSGFTCSMQLWSDAESVSVAASSNVRITNCTFSAGAAYGDSISCVVSDSENVTFSNCSFESGLSSGDYPAVLFANTSDSLIDSCIINVRYIRFFGSPPALKLTTSNRNVISRTSLHSDVSNAPALSLVDSNENVFHSDIFSIMGSYDLEHSNTSIIVVTNSFSNRFYHNNIQIPLGVAPPIVTNPNFWDDGYPSGGNYWSIYQGVDLYRGPLQDENGSDGIIDAPYNISLDNIDHYPLVNPWHPPPWFPIDFFDFSPLTPFVNETVTFDATNSYDLDGSLVNYAWDFGDGNVTTLTVPKIDHFYMNPGTYNASLTVTDNEGLNTTLKKVINVEKMPSSISLSTSTQTITIRENTTLSGAISPKRPETNVTLWSKLGSEDWITLANLTTNVESEYLYNWVPSKTGTYTLKASWSGDEYTFQNESAAIDFECRNISSSISISTNCASTYLGYKVNITGTLEDMYGNSLTNETVVLYYTFRGITTWTPITSDETDSFGNYFVVWIPPATGNYIVKAEWAGNATHSEVDNATTLSSVLYNYEYVFSVESNSTVSSLAYDSQNQLLSFRVNGSSGTEGYTRVTIAKTLVSNITNLKVRLDGSEYEYLAEDLGESWVLTFVYTHSTHQIEIALNPVPIPEFQTSFLLLLFMIASLCLVTVHHKSAYCNRKRSLAPANKKNLN